MRTILRALPLLLLAACGRELELPVSPGEAGLLAVDPSPGQVAPRGALPLVVSGGVPPYSIESVELSSGTTGEHPAMVTLEGSSLSYVAGETGSVVDRIQLSDSAGATIEARVSVGPALQVVPQVAAVPANGSLRFTVVGGQPRYTYAVTPQGCESDCASFDETEPGTYHASSNGTVDLVSITDENQAVVEVAVSLGDPFEVVTEHVYLSPGGSAAIVAHGGSGRYDYALEDPAFADVVRANDGLVEVPADAPMIFGVDLSADPDLYVRVSDAGRPTQSARVAIHIKPSVHARSTPAVRPGETLELLAQDGTPPYVFAFAKHGNLSFGEVTSSGVYRAGPNGELLDLVEVTDATGATALFQIEVGQLGIPGSAWDGLVEQSDQATQQFQFVAGHLFGTGLHLRLGADGIPVALPMVQGRLHDVTDLNGDGLPDVLVGPGNGGGLRSELWAYAGTLDGDLVFAGGGVQGSTALVADFGEAGRRVVLVDNAATPCAALTVPELLRGDAPPCAESPPTGDVYAVRTGDSGFAIVHGGAVDFYRAESVPLASPPVPLFPLRASCPLNGLSGLGPPIAADLDGNGRTEVAFLAYDSGETHLAVCRDDGNPPLVGLEALSANGPLFLGPRRADGTASVVVDLGNVRRAFDVGAGGISDGAPILNPDPSKRWLGTGDVDGDGFTDLLVEEVFGTLEFRLGDEAGGFAPRRRQRVGTAVDWSRAFAANLDHQAPQPGLPAEPEAGLFGDLAFVQRGHLRVLAGAERGDHLPVQGLTETPRPALALEADSGAVGAVGVIGTGDFLGDGRQGIALFDNRLDLQLYRVDGPGLLSAPISVALATDLGSLENLGKPLVARLQPGAPDSFVLPYQNGHEGPLGGLTVLTYDPGAGAFVIKSAELGGAPATGRPLVADLDADGVADVLAVDDCVGPAGCPVPRPFVFYKGEAGRGFTVGAPASLGDAGGSSGYLLGDPSGGAVWVAFEGCDATGCSEVTITLVTSTGVGPPRTVALPSRSRPEAAAPRLFDDKADDVADVMFGILGGFAVIPLDGGAPTFVAAAAPGRTAVPIPFARNDMISARAAAPDVGVVDLLETGSSSGVLRLFRRTAGDFEGQ